MATSISRHSEFQHSDVNPSNNSEGVHSVRNFDHSHVWPINSKGGVHIVLEIMIIHNCPSLPGHISCVKSISLSGFLHVFTKMARSNTSISYPLI